MPLGWERINTKRSVPNKNIVFIKALRGPNEQTAKDFLERIAAQCLPIMNKHYLAVTSLEEYEPNLEFWGRNFNNGEVIQLVLRSPSTGRWLPFKFVQMVMMHELAHNKQMNHSKQFWALRNDFATDMKSLWDKGYSGEGLWGRGVLLQNGAFTREELEDGETLPEHLCGGGFRSRGRKRKAKPKITYRERRERRERKMNTKYGSGIALGGDEETRVKLEKGKKPLSNPKKANTARGRELRAAAALARFETKQEEEEIKPNDDDLVTDSEAEDADVGDGLIPFDLGDAVDQNGKPLVDIQGRHMVKICKEEDKDDEDVRRELWELQNMGDIDANRQVSQTYVPVPRLPEQISTAVSKHTQRQGWEEKKQPALDSIPRKQAGAAIQTAGLPSNMTQSSEFQQTSHSSCPICSTENEPTELTCSVCANVLQPEAILNSWRCQSMTCKDSSYLNAGDVGLCGVCGARKCSVE